MLGDAPDDDDEDDFDGDLTDDSLDELVDESADDDGPGLVEEGKARAARTLEVRRAIEDRMEDKRLKDDLDYLDIDDL